MLHLTLSRVLILGIFLVTGCISSHEHIPSLNQKNVLHGIASWYGPSFHGKPSASGEPYDMWALTAAHQTLPFGTWVQVKKVSTGQTVQVRINDLGPFIKGRIIDLSYAAARKLGMIGEGTAEVSLTILTNSRLAIPHKQSQQFWVQAGAYTSLTKAMVLREQLAHDYDHVRVNTAKLASGEWHRVQIGSFNSREMAQQVSRDIKNTKGLESTIITSN